MYISNLIVDAAVKPLTKLFAPGAYGSDEIQGLKLAGTEWETEDFSKEPVYWPVGAPIAHRRYLRGHGAMAYLTGGGAQMVITLRTGLPIPAFMERDYVSSQRRVVPQAGSVVSNLKGRSFWSNVEDNIFAPAIGGGEEADYVDFVKQGRHAEGAAARLCALALEHGLVPFGTRVRVRNAAACYWCLGRYRSDNITFSLQNTQAAMSWSSPNRVGADNDPTCVIWVGDATKRRGMALLSRLFDAGGPIAGQEAYLLSSFDPGRLLMVGTGALDRELQSVQADELWIAIREAFFILEKYNNIGKAFVMKTLHTLVHDLAIVDLGALAERDFPWWRTREQSFGEPELDANEQARLLAEVSDALGIDDDVTLTAGRDDNGALRLGLFSDIGRRAVHNVPAGEGGFAPAINTRVPGPVAAMAGIMRAAHAAPINGENVAFVQTDLANPPNFPFRRAPTAGMFEGVWPVFSGRAAYRVFAISPPGVGRARPQLVAGFQAVADPALVAALDAEVNRTDGEWQEWVARPEDDGTVPAFETGLRGYVIRHFTPATADNYVDFVPPEGRLRRFDLPVDYRVGVAIGGNVPSLERAAQRIHRFLHETDIVGTDCEYLLPDGMNGLGGAWNNNARTALAVRGFARVWEAAHLGGTQNDAYGRWVNANRRNVRLTTIPDELCLYLGGSRVTKYLEPGGGLWVLCYLMEDDVKKIDAGLECVPYLEALEDPHQLSSFCLKLRATVEATDQLLRVTNSRIVGCRDAYPYDADLWNRVQRGLADGPLQLTPGAYIQQQAVYFGALFANTHGSVLNDFGVTGLSGLRVREPMRDAHMTLDHVRRLNWVTTQTLPNWVWSIYLGIAAPGFQLDRRGRAGVVNMRHTTQWVDYDPIFARGIFPDPQDELWVATLATVFNYNADLLSVNLSTFGSDAEVEVSRIRERYVEWLVPFEARLILPQETRLRRFAIPRPVDHALCPRFGQLSQNRRPNYDGLATLGNSTYDARGMFTPGALVVNPRVGAGADLDVRSTPWASNGFRLNVFDPHATYPYVPECRTAAGHFWLSAVPEAQGGAAAASPAAMLLIGALRPPPAIPVVGHDEGNPRDQVRGEQAANADPRVAANPANQNRGDVPLREEAEMTMQQLIGKLQGLAPEVQTMLTRAYLKQQMGMEVDATSAAPTASTVTMSQTGTGQSEYDGGDARAEADTAVDEE
jgi:hypothetical protein